MDVSALLANRNLTTNLQRILAQSAAPEHMPVARPARQVQRRLGQAEIAELVDDYRGGATVPMLASRFQIHRTTVLDQLERQGIERRPWVRKLSDTDVVEAARFYAEGESLDAVGVRFNVNARTIANDPAWVSRVFLTLETRMGHGNFEWWAVWAAEVSG